MTRTLVLLSLAVAFAGSSPAAEPKKLAEAVGPFLDDGSVVVVHVDLTTVKLADLKARLTKLAPMLAGGLEAPFAALATGQQALVKAGVHNAFVVTGTNQDPNRPPLVVLTRDVLATGNPIEAIGGLFPGKLAELNGAYAFGPEAQLTAIRERKAAAPAAVVADLAAAFENAGKAPARVAVVLPPALRRIVEENLPALPPPFGDVSGKLLSRGFRWGVVALDGDATAGYKVRVRVQAENAEAAGRFVKLAEAGLDALAAVKPPVPADMMQKMRRLLAAKADGDAVVLAVDDAALVEAALPLLAKAYGASAAAVDMNHLKQIGLAFHIHLDGNKNRFTTAAITDNQGQPLLSWRVRLLPYLGDDAKKLYDRFKLTEPWDSAHNKALLKEMPAFYRTGLDPKLAAEGKTTFVVPVGPDTIFPPGKPMRIVDVTDGTSNTILALEIDPAKAVPWTKPDDLVVDLKQPLANLGFDADGTVKVLMADGSVRRVAKTIAPATFAALLTRNGGEVVNPD